MNYGYEMIYDHDMMYKELFTTFNTFTKFSVKLAFLTCAY